MTISVVSGRMLDQNCSSKAYRVILSHRNERIGFGLVKSKCEMMGVWLRLHLCFGYFGGFLVWWG